jgi:tetratricopeptide (TPR) repeat protein
MGGSHTDIAGEVCQRPEAGEGVSITERELAAWSVLKSSAVQSDLYNFHQSEILDSLEAAVSGMAERTTVILPGEPGSGRTYLLDAVAHRLRAGGGNLSVLHLDLEGFEPDCGLASFLQHQALKQGATMERELLESLGAGESNSVWSASLIAIVYSCLKAGLEAQIRSLVEPNWSGLEEQEKLRLFFQKLTTGRRIILHVTDPGFLPAPVLQALATMAEANVNLLLAVSCEPRDLAGLASLEAFRQAPQICPIPLTADELQSVLNRNFTPNAFPSRFNLLTWRASRGLPVLTAALMFDFVSGGLIRREMDECWRISDDTVFLELENRLSSQAVSGWLQPQRISTLNAGERLPQFLILAGLCGENVPVGILLEYLGLAGEAADQFVDFIDESLVGETSLLRDLQYGHPSFPGQMIYQFSSALARRAVRECLAANERSTLLAEFWSFLYERLQVDTRGSCRLLLSVASWLEVDARTADIFTSLAGVVRKMGYLNDARIHFERALEITRRVYGRESRHAGAILKTLADLLRDMNLPRLAAACLKEALEIESAGDREQDSSISILRAILADLLSELGDFDAARAHHETSLRVMEKTSVGDSEEVLLLLNKLADLSVRLNDLGTARHYLQRALAVDESLHGAAHSQRAVQVKLLADVLWNLGDTAGSIACLERALAIEERIYGTADPRILPNLRYLEAVLRKTGKAGAANQCLRRLHEIELR